MTDAEQIQWEEARSAVYGFFSQAFIRGPRQQFLEALIADEGTEHLGEFSRMPPTDRSWPRCNSMLGKAG